MGFNAIYYADMEAVKSREGFCSVWGMTKYNGKLVGDINNPAEGFDNMRSLYYSQHSGPRLVVIDHQWQDQPTWLDLWRLADQAIRESGDESHTFIEYFDYLHRGVYELITGS